jgi:hypothetical protein
MSISTEGLRERSARFLSCQITRRKPSSCNVAVACSRPVFGRAWTQWEASQWCAVRSLLSLRLFCCFEKNGRESANGLCVLAWGRYVDPDNAEPEGVAAFRLRYLTSSRGETRGTMLPDRILIVVAVCRIGRTIHQRAQKFSAFDRFQAALQLLLFGDALARNQQHSVRQTGPNAGVRQWQHRRRVDNDPFEPGLSIAR